MAIAYMRETLLNCAWIVIQHILPAKLYLSLKYRVIFKKRLNWKSPQSFSEKLQWIKIYGCKPGYARMVDKLQLKDFVREKLGDGYSIPLLGAWNSPAEIDFDSLPDQFVLKCNHDSGTIVVCRDKSTFDKKQAIKKLNKAIRRNYYLVSMETPYKNMARKVFAEVFMQNDGLDELLDYKFFCFDGIPKIVKVDFGRNNNEHHANYYDMGMNLLPFGLSTSSPVPSKIFEKPESFEKMVEVARKLSEGISFVRVDLYNVSGKIFVGELTFFPASGLTPYTSYESDLLLGSWLTLPNVENNS